jgi:hypothetical protein
VMPGRPTYPRVTNSAALPGHGDLVGHSMARGWKRLAPSSRVGSGGGPASLLCDLPAAVTPMDLRVRVRVQLRILPAPSAPVVLLGAASDSGVSDSCRFVPRRGARCARC